MYKWYISGFIFKDCIKITENENEKRLLLLTQTQTIKNIFVNWNKAAIIIIQKIKIKWKTNLKLTFVALAANLN